MQLSCASSLAKLFLELLHRTVVPKLPCRIISQAFAWNCCSKLALRSYFLSSCMEPSCKCCLSNLFFKLLFGSVEQKLTCKAISQGGVSISFSRMLRFAFKKWQRSWAQTEPCWAQSTQSVRDAACSCHAEVALRSYFLSLCMELSCQSCLAELFLKPLRGTVVQNLLCEAIF